MVKRLMTISVAKKQGVLTAADKQGNISVQHLILRQSGRHLLQHNQAGERGDQ
jgi:hypothetical protein